MRTPVWISLGSNLGDRKSILDAAIVALAGTPGVKVQAASRYHETQPVGGPPGQGAFLNASAQLETALNPYELLEVMQEIENQAGRVRKVRWGERSLDLDILIFGSKSLESQNLQIPHPRLPFRRFVLAPLAEIAPNVVDILTGQTISDLLANLDRRPRLLALDGSEGWKKSTIFRRLVDELPGFGIVGENLERVKNQNDSPNRDFFEVLERKAEALRASHWAVENLRVPWIVSDYFIDLDLHRASAPTDPDGMQRARLLAEAALVPTLIVIIRSQTTLGRMPGLVTVPQLWPESDQPEAIVNEVLATCRAIEEV